MTIYKKAENQDSVEGYRKMYDTYGNLTYEEAYAVIQDAIGVFETKYLLGLDTANLSESELNVLIDYGKEIGKLAENCKGSIKTRERYKLLTRR